MNPASLEISKPGGKPYRLVSIKINDRCPLRCKHCCVGYSTEFKGSGWKIPEGELIDVIQAVDARVYQGVFFAGGEPSLEPELIRVGSLACRIHGLMPSIVSAPIWGSSLAAAERFLNIAAGLDQVILSFDHYHLDFLKVSHYENAARAAAARGISVSIHTCYTQEAERDGLVAKLASINHLVSFGATRTVPIGNAISSAAGVPMTMFPIQTAADFDQVPRGCVLGHTYISSTDHSVHGCCWSVTVDGSPFSRSSEKHGLVAALSELEASPLFTSMRKTGFLDALTPSGKRALAEKLKGRSFANECHVCITSMREAGPEIWTECVPHQS